MHVMRLLGVIFLALCGHTFSTGQEPGRVFSGPQEGETLQALRVVLAYGDDEGEIVDLVQLAGGRPTLLVIVNGSNRPAANLTRVLMNFAEIYGDRLFAGVVYLDGDQPAALQQLKSAVAWWRVGPPVGVSVDGAEGPGSYGLNRNVNVTVLFANGGQVIRNDALVQPSQTDAAKILSDVVRVIGGRVPTISEVLFLSVPTHQLPGVGWRKAPTDVRLRELICDALASQNDELAQIAAAAVESYVGDDQDRMADLGCAAVILLEGPTRIRDQPIVSHLRRWRTTYDVKEER